MDIYVFSENISLAAELITYAKGIEAGADVTAVVVGTSSDTDKISQMGVSRVCWLGELGGSMIDDFVPTIADLVKTEAPDLFLVGATVRGRAVAARVAASLNTTAIVNAKSISADGKVRHVIYGGGAVRAESVAEGILIATVAAGSAEASTAKEKAAPIVNVAFVEPAYCAKILECLPKKVGSSDILSAKRVVAAGRGFFTEEDLQYAKDLAEVMDAAVGYTRPVTEVEPPIAEGEPYFGVSGIQIKPDLYIALAISGQTQHTAGIMDSKLIVCINNDEEAPMFKLSNYGIVGDYKEVVPALIKAIKAEKNK